MKRPYLRAFKLMLIRNILVIVDLVLILLVIFSTVLLISLWVARQLHDKQFYTI